MWIIAIVFSLLIGLLIQGVIMPNDSGMILAVFITVIIMDGFIMYQLQRVLRNQKTIIDCSKKTKDL